MITMITACGGRRKVGLAIFLLSFMVLSGCADGSKTKLNSVKNFHRTILMINPMNNASRFANNGLIR